MCDVKGGRGRLWIRRISSPSSPSSTSAAPIPPPHTAILGISVLVSNVAAVVLVHYESVLREEVKTGGEKDRVLTKQRREREKKESVAPVLEEEQAVGKGERGTRRSRCSDPTGRGLGVKLWEEGSPTH